jgi:2-octaprenyl-6-methoxyphenol hydroxylase
MNPLDQNDRFLIVGGGPVGLAFALMLARRRVASEVLDARSVEAAQADRRLLALSRGTLELLGPLVELQHATTAPIRKVVVSSAGEFGRVVIGAEELGLRPLGVTVRYGDLLAPLARACAANPFVAVRRPSRVTDVSQRPTRVTARLEGGAEIEAPLLVNAEGTSPGAAGEPQQIGLVADVLIDGPAAGAAFERFTRDGPLALLPLPGPSPASGRNMSMVWCMPAAEAARRLELDEAAFSGELQQAFGARSGRIIQVGPRARYPLHQQARETLREHRVVWIGNAAQTLHPVAGQGLNLGMRDAAQLADDIAGAMAAQRDPATMLASYESQRRIDRAAMLGLTRRVPGLFATRAAPVAIGRSLALVALSAVPGLRQQLARLLMFGVRG